MLKKVIIFFVILVLVIFLTTSIPSVKPAVSNVQFDKGMLGEPAK